MEQPGYIYLLINASMNGIVKIGRTTRNPQDRVDELSSATGVPTPFILIYKEKFNDCIKAERIIHEILEKDKYRISKSREFFNIPPYEAIPIIQNVKIQIEGNLLNEDNIDNNDSYLEEETYDLTSSLYQEGLNHYYGLTYFIQDFVDAYSVFEKTALLDHGEATKLLGLMNLLAQGCKKNVLLALDYFKKAIKLNEFSCYALMAITYSTQDKHIHPENSNKCWANYFNSLEINNLKEEDLMYITEYITLKITKRIFNNHDPNKLFLDKRLLPAKKEIVDYIERRKKRMQTTKIRSEDRKITQQEKNLMTIHSLHFTLPVYSVNELILGSFYINKNTTEFSSLVYHGETTIELDGKNTIFQLFKESNDKMYVPLEVIESGKIEAIIQGTNIQLYNHIQKVLMDSF